MHPFTLTAVNDPQTAIDAHASDDRLAYINGLPGMSGVEALADGTLRIGALARMSDVAADPLVRERYPVIAESLLFAASGQLRNMASIGGNIMQRTRCAYFRDGDGLPCNKRQPGSGCAALHGLNRNHAIFGWSDDCVATHPSDVAVAFAALDANVIVRGRDRWQAVPFTEFHRLPGSTPEQDTVLRRDELIVAVEVPAREEGTASHYLKVRDRQSYEFALVSVAAAVTADDGRLRTARLAMGGVAHKPWRLTAAESALRGVALHDLPAIGSAIAASFTDARPLAHNAFKVELAQRAVLRALVTAGGRA
jgi:xanthine dehydrogenase YagS FAD-binding subunit